MFFSFHPAPSFSLSSLLTFYLPLFTETTAYELISSTFYLRCKHCCLALGGHWPTGRRREGVRGGRSQCLSACFCTADVVFLFSFIKLSKLASLFVPSLFLPSAEPTSWSDVYCCIQWLSIPGPVVLSTAWGLGHKSSSFSFFQCPVRSSKMPFLMLLVAQLDTRTMY